MPRTTTRSSQEAALAGTIVTREGTEVWEGATGEKATDAMMAQYLSRPRPPSLWRRRPFLPRRGLARPRRPVAIWRARPVRLELCRGVDRGQTQLVSPRVAEAVQRVRWRDHDLASFGDHVRIVHV